MNAVAYLRLSTRDQSKSLEYQESIIRDYCKRNKLKILAVFQDNGEGSYSFDRPNYKALEKFIKLQRGKCQYIIVLDHDRFSRNLPEALIKIAELERKYDVKVISTQESIDLDTSDPDVFMRRAFDYLIANKELFTIRNRTKLGIRNAKENGRYIGYAPFGYRNIKDEEKNSSIIVDPSEAIIIRKIFKEYLSGLPLYLVQQNAKSIGFKNTSKSAIRNVLNNCVYAGLIYIGPTKNSPEKYVKGLHNAIVDEADFWSIKKMLESKRPVKQRASNDFPLRGILKCNCGRNMTAGWSKGRRQHYLYYKCSAHPGSNISGKMLHFKFEQILKKIKFQPMELAIIKQMVSDKIMNNMIKQGKSKQQAINEIKVLDRKQMRLEEKFISDKIDDSTYKTWSKKLQKEKIDLLTELNSMESNNTHIQSAIDKILSNPLIAYKLYSKSKVAEKHELIQTIFRNELTWNDGKFYTTFFNPILECNLVEILEDELLVLMPQKKLS